MDRGPSYPELPPVVVVQHSVRTREKFDSMNLALVLQAGWHEGGTNGNVMLRPECFRHLQRRIVLTLITQLTSKHMDLEGIVKMLLLLCFVNLVIVAVALYRCSSSLCSCSYDPYHDVLMLDPVDGYGLWFTFHVRCVHSIQFWSPLLNM
jgi:hypothetical protein